MRLAVLGRGCSHQLQEGHAHLLGVAESRQVADILERSDALYFEHQLNCAIRDGDWKLVCKGKNGLAVKDFDWELYNVKADRAELQNVADKNPGKVEALLAKWEKWAVRAKVQPWPYQTK